MITRVLLVIKHRLPWLWAVVERLNTLVYGLLCRRDMQLQVKRAFANFELRGFEFRPLSDTDLHDLQSLIRSQGEERLRYFRPHGFDMASLKRMHTNSAFLMFGVFCGERLVGYFFLRCFWNRKCFVGRLIDEPYEGRGIGRVMNQILYHCAWWSGFKCLTTISKHNAAIMRSHQRNPHARVVGSLANDYLLVEFVPLAAGDGTGL